MRFPFLHTALSVVSVLVLGGCAPGFGGPDVGGPAPSDEVLVRVKNNNWADMTVYAIRAGTRMRLGMVTSMTEQVFRLPRAFVTASSDVQLLLDPIGSSQGYLTEPILVSPGQTVEMNVENNIRLTNWAVW